MQMSSVCRLLRPRSALHRPLSSARLGSWAAANVLTPDHGLPVIASPDVVVVGGGVAGVAAATVAAEKGQSVLLIERYGFCGGNAVAGYSGTICGMYLASESATAAPTQVVWGFTQRFRQAIFDAGGLTGPQRFGKTWTVTHEPHIWRETADAFLTQAGARVLYHTMVTGVVMEGEHISGLTIDGKSGRAAVTAKQVIDASGDADVIFRAGWQWSAGDMGKVQNPTMIFRLANVDMKRFSEFWGPDTICSPTVTSWLVDAKKTGRYDVPRAKVWLFPTPRPGELMCNCTRVIGRDGRELYAGDTEDLTEAEFAGRLQVREYARFLKDHIPGCEQSYLQDTGVQAGIRQSRSIAGVLKLTDEDVLSKRKFPDAIVKSPWPIELHSGEKPRVEWLIEDYYEVPYGTLIPEKGDNILVAGRCLSSEHAALASCRVTAQCFNYGQAAGLAAAEALRSGRRMRDLSGEEVRAMANAEGARLDD